MVLEKRLKEIFGKKGFNTSVYLIGGAIEILGILALFSPETFFNWISNTFIVGIILAVGGFLLAVSVRK